MIRLVASLRRRLAQAPADDRWDDHGVEDVAATMARLAASDDAGAPAASASRAAVLGAFAAASQNSHRGAPGRALPHAGAAPEGRRGGRRPVLALVMASALVVIVAGTVAAAAPGGPLYQARVTAEALFLPSDPTGRATAQLARMDVRVAEAEQAARQGDEGGATAALLAYARIATDVAAGPAVDPATDSRLAAEVRTQLRAITAIGAGDPALATVTASVQLAAGQLLTALGQPLDDSGPSISPPSTGPSSAPAGSPSPSSSNPGPAPSAGGTGGGSGPIGPASPGATPRAPSPGATSGPAGSGGAGQQGAPHAGGSPAPSGAAAPTPQATSAAPSPTPPSPAGSQAAPGGGGSGSSGGGANGTPSPSPGASSPGAGSDVQSPAPSRGASPSASVAGAGQGAMCLAAVPDPTCDT